MTKWGKADILKIEAEEFSFTKRRNKIMYKTNKRFTGRDTLRISDKNVHGFGLIGSTHFLIKEEFSNDWFDNIFYSETSIPLDKDPSHLIPSAKGQLFEPLGNIENDFIGGVPRVYNEDKSRAVDARYYWLLVEKMGFELHEGMTKDDALAITFNGIIIGALMPLVI